MSIFKGPAHFFIYLPADSEERINLARLVILASGTIHIVNE